MLYTNYNNELYHHGVKGQKWGVRRYQNADGSLTKAGKKRESKNITKEINKYEKQAAISTAKSYVEMGKSLKYNKKYKNAISKNQTEKAEKYLEKKKMYDEKVVSYLDSIKKNKELIENAKSLVSKKSDYIITYKRGRAYGGTDVDGGSVHVDYDKTKIRLNNEKNRNKYSKKQNEKGYRFTKTYTY